MAQSKSYEVKIRMKNESGEMENKVVGTATYLEYDAVSEALESLGEEKCLELINAQVRTNEMNRVRGLARNGPGKKALEDKALKSFTAEDWQEIATSADQAAALRAKVESKVAALRAELVPAGGGEDDES